MQDLRNIVVGLFLSLFLVSCATPTIQSETEIETQNILGYQLIQRGEIDSINFSSIKKQLDWMWRNTGELEYLGCLHGVMVNDNLHIVGMEVASFENDEPHSVTGTCRLTESFVGAIHPHKIINPDNTKMHCRLSDEDYRTFMIMKMLAFNIVQCGPSVLFVPTDKVEINN